MKAKLYFSIAFLSLVTCAFGAAQTAVVRMYCLSIEVGHGVNDYGDTVDFNYLGPLESAGEFAPWWPNGSGLYYDITLPDIENHVSTMSIYDSYYGYSSSGPLTVALPMTDANNNRFPDFFELARSASYTTTGDYYFYDSGLGGYDSGLVTSAVWTRSAGSRSGSYAFTFHDNTLGVPADYWGTFHGTFKILEYTGTLSYTPGSNVVTGTINLVQTGVPANTWQGAIQFTKVGSDRFNSMTNQPGFWINGSSQIYNFTNHYFFRDPSYPTNYAGYIEFDNDADLSSLYPYATWVLSITDTNDVNHNGIPDFSDDPTTLPPPRRPLLSLTRTPTNLLFSIHGDINHLHQIQQVPAVSSTNWQPVVSVTLTNDPQVVPVAFPTGSTFYRVQAQ